MPIPTLADYESELQLPTLGSEQRRSTCPLISVVTVVKNNANQLAATIDSIIQQTYTDFEYIVIDGGSTDGTIAVLERYQKHIDCWISTPDQGIYDAMNKGITRAKGQIVATLNAGDLYLPSTLELVAKAYQQSIAKHVMIAGDLQCITSHNYCLHKHAHAGISNLHIAVHQPALFVSKSVYQKFGLFDTTYRIAGDYDFVLRTYQQVTLVFLGQFLTQTAPEGVSGDYYAATLESHRARLSNGYPRLAAYLVTAGKLARVFLHIFLDQIQAWQIFERIRHQTNIHQPKLPS